MSEVTFYKPKPKPELLGDTLKKYEPPKEKSKHISQEFQLVALNLAEKLNDKAHMGIYMRMAKNTNPALIDRALSFVIDSNAKNKAALFMWKIKQLKINLKEKKQ